jgi:hypothetical protein
MWYGDCECDGHKQTRSLTLTVVNHRLPVTVNGSRCLPVYDQNPTRKSELNQPRIQQRPYHCIFPKQRFKPINTTLQAASNSVSETENHRYIQSRRTLNQYTS